MDPRDDLDSLAGGVGCAACGELVPTDRVRVLARRDDIAFVEIQCVACRSESLAIVIGASPSAEPVRPASAGRVEAASDRPYGEFGPGDAARFRDARTIGAADLERVHELLARGGLDALVGGFDSPPSGPTR
ncbi:MAG TPA: hypothetical protein VM427_06540 [Patescibacteria group bacterium]|nr:hypothetical protein [Patescibacteria group bacterium]